MNHIFIDLEEVKLKKSIVLVLSFVMLILIASCGNGTSVTTTTSTAESQTASPTTSEPTTTNAEAVDPTAVPTEAENTNTIDTPTTPDQSASDTIGYVTDNVDHWARPAYNFTYYTMAASSGSALHIEALKQAGETYNFNITELNANGDSNTYVTNLQTLLLTKPDGLLIDVAPEFQRRVAEIIIESDVPCVAFIDTVRDEEGHTLLPNVVMDNNYNGGRQVDWLNSNYTRYWGEDVDRSEIALLCITWTIGIDLNTRGEGMQSKFKELFPGNPIYIGDAATESFSEEGGYNLVTSNISAHPEVKYWFIACIIEEFALGASRAVEAMQKEDCVLITSSGASILPAQWDEGYDGVWVANYSVSPYQYMLYSVFGLIALCDGRATYETLWPDYIREGDKAANFDLHADMMTRDNYKQYLGDIVRSFGMEYKG